MYVCVGEREGGGAWGGGSERERGRREREIEEEVIHPQKLAAHP